MPSARPSSAEASLRRGDVSRGGRGTVRRRAPVSVSAAGDTGAVRPAVSGGGPPAVRPARPKRIRTTFKCHELQLMKSYFELNHNPDNNDLKQLSHKTGLSKRVLQASHQLLFAVHRHTSGGNSPGHWKSPENMLNVVVSSRATSESINADSLNSNFLQLGRRSGGRPQRTVHPRQLLVNTVMHTTLVASNSQPSDFWSDALPVVPPTHRKK